MLNVNQKTIFIAYSQIPEEGMNRFIVKYEAVLTSNEEDDLIISDYIIDEELYNKHKKECNKDKEKFEEMIKIWLETLPSKQENKISSDKNLAETQIII